MFRTDLYLDYRLGKLYVPVKKTENGKYVWVRSGFSNLRLEADRHELLIDELKIRIRKELENASVPEIDYFFETL